MSQSNHFKPSPGFVLARPLKREELHGKSSLAMPDGVANEKDAVGIAEVVELGKQKDKDPDLMLEPGDLIAYMPYTDVIIMDGFEKRNLVAYKNIVAIAKGGKQDATES